MLETIELPKETVGLPTVVDATPRDVAEPVGEADEEWEEEEKKEKDEKLVTFGPLPNEEPPASVLILDFLCNASFLPQACSGCFHDDAADWERIAYSMEHKSRKKEKTSKRSSSRTKNKASLRPRAMVVTVRDGSDESVDDGESASTRKSTDDSSTISHTSGSGGGSSSTNSNSNGNSHSRSGARPPRYRRPLLPPRVPSSRRTSWSSNSSLSPIVIGEQRDDVEVSKGRNRYKEQLSAAAAGLLRKKSRDSNNNKDDRKPPSYTISVKSYHPARDAPSEAPLEDTKNDDSTISDIGELTASDDDDDKDKENDGNKDNNNDNENEGTKPAVVTMGSF